MHAYKLILIPSEYSCALNLYRQNEKMGSVRKSSIKVGKGGGAFFGKIGHVVRYVIHHVGTKTHRFVKVYKKMEYWDGNPCLLNKTSRFLFFYNHL